MNSISSYFKLSPSENLFSKADPVYAVGASALLSGAAAAGASYALGLSYPIKEVMVLSGMAGLAAAGAQSVITENRDPKSKAFKTFSIVAATLGSFGLVLAAPRLSSKLSSLTSRVNFSLPGTTLPMKAFAGLAVLNAVVQAVRYFMQAKSGHHLVGFDHLFYKDDKSRLARLEVYQNNHAKFQELDPISRVQYNRLFPLYALKQIPEKDGQTIKTTLTTEDINSIETIAAESKPAKEAKEIASMLHNIHFQEGVTKKSVYDLAAVDGARVALLNKFMQYELITPAEIATYKECLLPYTPLDTRWFYVHGKKDATSTVMLEAHKTSGVPLDLKVEEINACTNQEALASMHVILDAHEQRASIIDAFNARFAQQNLSAWTSHPKSPSDFTSLSKDRVEKYHKLFTTQGQLWVKQVSFSDTIIDQFTLKFYREDKEPPSARVLTFISNQVQEIYKLVPKTITDVNSLKDNQVKWIYLALTTKDAEQKKAIEVPELDKDVADKLNSKFTELKLGKKIDFPEPGTSVKP